MWCAFVRKPWAAYLFLILLTKLPTMPRGIVEWLMPRETTAQERLRVVLVPLVAALSVRGCTHAILKAKSPSCGVGEGYDGTCSQTVVDGDGRAAEVLRNVGIKLAPEKGFDQVFKGDFD